MNVSKWSYNPEQCSKGICKGDCDDCERGIGHICQIIARYLDRHPDLMIESHVHVVNCKWKHEVYLIDKLGKKNKAGTY